MKKSGMAHSQPGKFTRFDRSAEEDCGSGLEVVKYAGELAFAKRPDNDQVMIRCGPNLSRARR